MEKVGGHGTPPGSDVPAVMELLEVRNYDLHPFVH